jgi:hypothetical protein
MAKSPKLTEEEVDRLTGMIFYPSVREQAGTITKNQSVSDPIRPIGKSSAGGWLVYGGGRVGLMGSVANAALAAGARILQMPRIREAAGGAGTSGFDVWPALHRPVIRLAESARPSSRFVCPSPGWRPTSHKLNLHYLPSAAHCFMSRMFLSTAALPLLT